MDFTDWLRFQSGELPWVGFIVVYALLVAAGGIFGYVKARSKVSLISGLGSGVVLLIAARITLEFAIGGLALAGLVAFILVIVFAIRYAKTRTWLPVGFMTVSSIISTILFWWGMLGFLGRAS